MEILLDKKVLLHLSELNLPEEEILDAAILPDIIEELSNGQKEFFKKFDSKVLKLTVTVKDQRQIMVLSAEWIQAYK